jgi:hypothetical protein
LNNQKYSSNQSTEFNASLQEIIVLWKEDFRNIKDLLKIQMRSYHLSCLLHGVPLFPRLPRVVDSNRSNDSRQQDLPILNLLIQSLRSSHKHIHLSLTQIYLVHIYIYIYINIHLNIIKMYIFSLNINVFNKFTRRYISKHWH